MVAEGILTRDGGITTIDDAALATFANALGGELLFPGSAEYDTVRRVWNGMIDRHPALIARCTSAADVAAAVRFARRHDLRVTVRGGGHNVAGSAVADGALMIDLAPMQGVEVDPAARIARVQPGVRWAQVDQAAQAHGLATPGGVVSQTGVAGFTLAGGMGWLRGKYGLASDNLLSVEIVTADGDVLRASDAEHADLFWAVRGGGGNFGIVTEFVFQLHPAGPDVATAAVIYPLAAGRAVLHGFREFALQAPDEITVDAYIRGIPPFPFLPEELHGAPMVLIAALYAGDPAAGERALQPLRELAEPIADLSGVVPYVAFQSGFDASYPDVVQRYYWKSIFLDTLSDEGIEGVIALAERRLTPDTLLALRALGGALTRVPENATAYANRAARWNLSIDATWTDPAADEELVSWTQRAWRELRDATDGGVYLNFAGLGEENDELARAGYRTNYARLIEVKRRYDPTNVYRANVNVRP